MSKEDFFQLCDDLIDRKNKNKNTKFTQLADYLFRNCCLEIKNRVFYFTELEFYYESENHQDKFRHNATQQQTRGEIYWHKSGIDITIGKAEKNIYGGVLIRGIKEEKNNGGWKYTTGPCNLVSKIILPAIDINNAVYYGRQKLLPGQRRITNADKEFQSKKIQLRFNHGVKEKFTFNMLQSCRVGLNKGKFSETENPQLKDFIYRPYRYIIDTDQARLFEEKEKMSFISAVLGLIPNKKQEETYLKLAANRDSYDWKELGNYYVK